MSSFSVGDGIIHREIKGRISEITHLRYVGGGWYFASLKPRGDEDEIENVPIHRDHWETVDSVFLIRKINGSSRSYVMRHVPKNLSVGDFIFNKRTKSIYKIIANPRDSDKRKLKFNNKRWEIRGSLEEGVYS